MTRGRNLNFCLPAAHVWNSRWHKICLISGSILICFRIAKFHLKFFRWNLFKRATTKLVTLPWRRGAKCVVRNPSARHVSSVPRLWSRPFGLRVRREGRREGGWLFPGHHWTQSTDWELIGRQWSFITYKGQVYHLLPALVIKVHGCWITIYLRTVKDNWTSFKIQIL